jgi:hypothetical protein
MSIELRETSATLAKAGAQRWKAVLISPGQGSSGIYSESMLKQYGPSAFPKGTHSYVDHPAHGEQRSPTNLFGVLAESAHYEDGVGLVGELEVMPHWAEFAEAVGPHVGLSIFAAGTARKDENGNVVVESLEYNLTNSVDLVSYAGRGGSLAERLYESAIRHGGKVREDADGDTDTNPDDDGDDDPIALAQAADAAVDAALEILEGVDTTNLPAVAQANSLIVAADAALDDLLELLGADDPDDTSATSTESLRAATARRNTTKENTVEITELGEKVDKIAEGLAALTAVLTPLAESLTAAAEPVVEEKEEIDFARVAEAAIDAGLPAAARKAVYEKVRLTGSKVEDVIAEQKSLVDDMRKQVAEAAGLQAIRVGGESANQDWTVARWKGNA